VTLTQTNPAMGQLPCKPGPNYGSGRYADLIDRCYWSYPRLYVPRGAVLQSSATHNIPAEWMLLGKSVTGTVTVARGENGTQSFGTLVVVPFSSTVTTSVQYLLAPVAAPRPGTNGQTTYTLILQKQAGTDALPVQLTVRLPPGASVRSASPSGQQAGDTWRLALTLLQNTQIQISYTTP
jgi:hypothetical protein